MDPNTQRAEAERWLGIAAKLLTARDFLGSKTFAIRAREADPNNSVSDQILAVVDTVISAEKRVDTTQQPDWYAVLQLPRMVRDADLIADHYRRLALLLSPEHNRLPFADFALQLVMEAWSVLSDPTKKWLFDNELALSLQRGSSEPQRVEPVRADPIRVDPGSVGSAQLNTFQFFQSQPPPPPPQMWQQQLPPQMSPREFMPPPQPQPPPSGLQQLPSQWQMRDPTPANGGERNMESMVGIRSKGGTVLTSTKAPSAPPKPLVAAAMGRSTPAPAPAPPPVIPTTPASARRNQAEVGEGVEVGSVGNAFNNQGCDNNVANGASADAGGANENVVEGVECFWTSCPYCFYIYEYQKKYRDCTLRCQNCRRGFHALQIPNPPHFSLANDGRCEKDKESSFCSWGFFPLGFSMAAWKKQNQCGNPHGPSTWVPFSPMFTCPMENGGGNFQWFASNHNASVILKNAGRKSSGPNASGPRVYIDDDEDFVEVSDTSDSDSSDRDWRNTSRNKKHKKGRIGGVKRGRPRKEDKLSQGNQDSIGGGGVYVAGEDLDDGSTAQEVVLGLVAGVKTDASNNVASTVPRKQTRRSMKDMGRLDLNVEFNNENDEHAPAVSAVNGEEDGIENIGFFEGLDEFLSTLPILNVGRDEKTKPS